MRIIPFWFLPIVAAGCTPEPSTNTASVDINAAAMQAQDAVDAYGANAGTGHDAAVAVRETDAANETAAANDKDGSQLSSVDPATVGTPGGLSHGAAPVPEAAPAPATETAQGGANVVQAYYTLIGERKYARAFTLRDAETTGPHAAADFAASFARYSEYHAIVGVPGEVEAGAGQRYVTVPVQVDARLKAGATPVHEIGSVTLHRTGEIDGATTAQRTWHIRSIDLKPAATR